MRNEQSPERVVKLVSCAQRATRLSLFPSHPTVPALPQGVCDKDTGVQPTHFRDPISFMITLLLHIILAGRACDPRVSIAGVRHTAADCTKMSSGVVAVLRTWAARARSAVDGANATGFAIRGRTARATIGGAPHSLTRLRRSAGRCAGPKSGGSKGGQPRGAGRRATRRPVRRGKRCLHAVVRSRSRFVLQRVQQEIRIREQIEFFGCSKEQEPRGKMWVRSDSL